MGSKTTKRWKEQGLCIRCGGKYGERVTAAECQHCRDKGLESKKRSAERGTDHGARKRWLEAGLCSQCGGKHGPRVTKTLCLHCKTKASAERDWKKHAETVAACRKRWLEAGLCGHCGGKHGPRVNKAECLVCRDKRRSRSSRHRRRAKDAAYAAYGGYKCACCGVTEEVFLTLDHMNNDGTEQRKIHGNGVGFYCWLKRNGYPEGFQVLCFNCNHGRHLNGGVCPHQLARVNVS